jgi:large repetitive protein
MSRLLFLQFALEVESMLFRHLLQSRPNDSRWRETFVEPKVPRLVWRVLALVLLGLVPFAIVQDRVLGESTNQERPGPDDPIPIKKVTGKVRSETFSAAQSLRFEQNIGQTDSQVDYLVRGLNHNVYLSGPSMILHQACVVSDSKKLGHVLRMNWVGANEDVSAKGEEPLAATTNYLIGSDKDKWVTHIHNYRVVRYCDMYPGITIVYHAADNGSLEYDAVLAPGARVADLQMRYEGANSVEVDDDGRLRIDVGYTRITKSAPVVYQVNGRGEKEVISGRYVIHGENTIGFEVGDYDPSRELVIDPTLGYSTFLGGSSSDTAYDVAVDSSNCVYITGSTLSPDFPTKTGSYDVSIATNTRDAFVTKLNPAQNNSAALIYSTYVGGNTITMYGRLFPGNEDSFGIAVDADGSAYITGSTNAYDFPTTNGTTLVYPHPSQIPDNEVATNAFMTKLNPAGSGLDFSTIVGRANGGYGNYNWLGYDIAYWAEDRSQIGRGIVVDSSEVAYIVGGTTGMVLDAIPFWLDPLPPADYLNLNDAFVSRIATNSGSITTRWNICDIGASSPNPFNADTGHDFAYGVARDSEGYLYITGSTFSTNFASKVTGGGSPAQGNSAGGSDAFVTKVNSGLTSMIYSTYLGGSDHEVGYGIAVDNTGAAYVTGSTGSSNFPVTSGVYQSSKMLWGNGLEAFVTKVNTTGTEWSYSTYADLPEEGAIAYAIVLDSSKNAHITGQTNGLAPVDAFVMKLNSTGTSLLASYVWGGSGPPGGSDIGYGIALDSSGRACVVGFTESSDFPTTTGAYNTLYNDNRDAFFSRINF